jgi:uncharacterized protein
METRGLIDRLVLLTHGLQAGGVPTALTEVIDAANALSTVDLLDRSVVRECLRATLVKRPDDEGIFDLLFDRYFSTTRAEPIGSTSPDGPAAGSPTDSTPPGSSQATADSPDPSNDLLRKLMEAIRNGDLESLRSLAEGLVDEFSGLEGAASTERYHLYRVMRAADLGRLLADAARELRNELDHHDALGAKVATSENDALLEEFRRLIAETIRGRLIDLVGAQDVVRSTRIEEMEVMKASTTDLRALRDAVKPLARRLAARMAARRRMRNRGKLDLRRTTRRSMQFGGVPVNPAFRDRKASKPDVVVLCDLSGSVAEFANFTLQLLTALHGELARLRSFVFVDGISEVTDLIMTAEHAVDPRYLVSRPGVVVADGHSDYAKVFEQFVAEHLSALRPTTTVIVAGDARSNYRPTGDAALKVIAERSKQVLWFNPEPSEMWNTSDSRLAAYRPHCRAVFEVRTLRQLADAVAELA